MHDNMLLYVANNNQLTDSESYMMLIFHDEKIMVISKYRI